MTLILSGTDGLSDIDGSAATPAVRGTDANTGIFFGTDTVGIATGGTAAITIGTDQNTVLIQQAQLLYRQAQLHKDLAVQPWG